MKQDSKNLDGRTLWSKVIVGIAIALLTITPTLLLVSMSNYEISETRLPIALLILFSIVLLNTAYLRGYDVDDLTKEQKESFLGKAITSILEFIHRARWVVLLFITLYVANS